MITARWPSGTKVSTPISGSSAKRDEACQRCSGVPWPMIGLALITATCLPAQRRPARRARPGRVRHDSGVCIPAGRPSTGRSVGLCNKAPRPRHGRHGASLAPRCLQDRHAPAGPIDGHRPWGARSICSALARNTQAAAFKALSTAPRWAKAWGSARLPQCSRKTCARRCAAPYPAGGNADTALPEPRAGEVVAGGADRDASGAVERHLDTACGGHAYRLPTLVGHGDVRLIHLHRDQLLAVLFIPGRQQPMTDHRRAGNTRPCAPPTAGDGPPGTPAPWRSAVPPPTSPRCCPGAAAGHRVRR